MEEAFARVPAAVFIFQELQQPVLLDGRKAGV